MKKRIKRQFARHKTYEEIKAQCEAQGIELLDQRFHEGGDCVAVRGGGAHAVYSTFNGRFWGKTPNGVLFNSQDMRHDGLPWMRGLLNFFLVKA